jgi:RNA-directed DNA polymerase
MGAQKSAEAEVAAAQGGEGPNTRSRTGAMRSMHEGGAAGRAGMPERPRTPGDGIAQGTGFERQAGTARGENAGDEAPMLMEEVLRRENLMKAYARVVKNGGAPGVDGMNIDELWSHCQKHWARIREELLSGTYVPQPVRRVEIPKPNGGGTRTLGIPTVLDRMIQQAVLQVLQPMVDPTFSDASYGFRPGRSAHGAVKRARGYVQQGYEWVVDVDIEKFFDRVNHDVLMARVARRVKDKRVLLLIRRFLQAGIMADGLVSQRVEGTPQGGPLSPLLSNILLDELDQELQRRGHRFVRYADDCNVYVRSEEAGKRVMASMERFLEKRLRLKINRDKSAVARPWERKFLGYTVTRHGRTRMTVAPQSIKRLKGKLRDVNYIHPSATTTSPHPPPAAASCSWWSPGGPRMPRGSWSSATSSPPSSLFMIDLGSLSWVTSLLSLSSTTTCSHRPPCQPAPCSWTSLGSRRQVTSSFSSLASRQQLHVPSTSVSGSSLFVSVPWELAQGHFSSHLFVHPSTTIMRAHPPLCQKAPCSWASPASSASGPLSSSLPRSGCWARSSPGSRRGARGDRSPPRWSSGP